MQRSGKTDAKESHLINVVKNVDETHMDAGRTDPAIHLDPLNSLSICEAGLAIGHTEKVQRWQNSLNILHSVIYNLRVLADGLVNLSDEDLRYQQQYEQTSVEEELTVAIDSAHFKVLGAKSLRNFSLRSLGETIAK